MTAHGETLQDHHSRIKELETALAFLTGKHNDLCDASLKLTEMMEETIKHVLERLHQLEEKERRRAYDEHQHELNFDTWKEAREKYGSEGC